jgi:hypothetical protein
VGRPRAFWIDVAVKAALVGLLAFGAFSGLQQFEGKAFGARLATYPLSLVVVPAAWWLRGRGRGSPFPYGVDTLLGLPFLIDVLGNAFDLYDSISWWDDVNHYVNWAILTGAFGLFLLRLSLARWVTFGLAVGFGAVTAILWELGEYFAFIRHSSELSTAYTDTLGDLSLGLFGSTTAAALVVLVARRRASS